jgi:hypothetical protein
LIGDEVNYLVILIVIKNKARGESEHLTLQVRSTENCATIERRIWLINFTSKQLIALLSHFGELIGDEDNFSSLNSRYDLVRLMQQIHHVPLFLCCSRSLMALACASTQSMYDELFS